MENVDNHRSSLPRHGPSLQSSVSNPAPGHSFPPPKGLGLVQVRDRFRFPCPQETEHGR